MVSLIIPTYRERENLDPLFSRLAAVQRRFGEPLEVLVVDSASDDGTADDARTRLGGRLSGDRGRTIPACPDIGGAAEGVPPTGGLVGRVIECSRDVGLAEAVVAGASQARGELLAVMDADLSHPPELLPELVRAVRDGHDVAVASRYVPGGRITNWPLARRLASRLANHLARPLVPVADATSGYFVCRAELLRSLAPRPKGFKILLEILARGRVRRIREVPYVFTDRVRGSSKLKGRTMGLFAAQLAALYLDRMHRHG